MESGPTLAVTDGKVLVHLRYCHSNLSLLPMSGLMLKESEFHSSSSWQGFTIFHSQLVQDYAKTDGLDYICPHCSITNFTKKPSGVVTNGFSQGSMASKTL